MITFAVGDFEQPCSVIKVGDRTDERPALLTSYPPHASKLSYHQLSDQLHQWFRTTLGTDYHHQVCVVTKSGYIHIGFDKPQTALLFKLTWGGQ